ncbi:MAG TPA: carboxypeptidase-like regulatory domain-containing protein [Terriglobales bacterium]|nr:carboxypeptidase-like regulatory domain-containing protein [Terriglobales bacterium]
MKVLVLVGVMLLSLPTVAQNDKDKNDKNKDDDLGPVAALSFLVRRDAGGKPVVNAVVVLHEVNEKGQQAKGGVELKTDLEGKAGYEGVPYGKIRVQVLANGFQTFGADYDINQPTLQINVSLKRPQSQYSAYDDHSGGKADSNNKPPPQ